MMFLRWLLVPVALVVSLPLLGVAVVAFIVFPPHVTITAAVILGLFAAWLYSLRRRTSGDSGGDGEASLLPMTKAKGGLL